MHRTGANEPREQTTMLWTKGILAATRQVVFKLRESAMNPNLFYTVSAQKYYVNIF